MKQDYFYLDYEDTICERGETLYRVIYTKDIHDFLQTPQFQLDVLSGELGGYVSSYANIDQDTQKYSYVCSESKVFSDARISGSVIINSELGEKTYVNNCFIVDSKLKKVTFDATDVYNSKMQNICAIESKIVDLHKEYDDDEAIVVSHRTLGGHYVDENGNKLDYKPRDLAPVPKKDWSFAISPLITSLTILIAIYIILN